MVYVGGMCIELGMWKSIGGRDGRGGMQGVWAWMRLIAVPLSSMLYPSLHSTSRRLSDEQTNHTAMQQFTGLD